MNIRPLRFEDRDKIFRLLKQNGTFNGREIEVAMEVIDDALRRPQGRDYRVFCAIDDSHALAGYVCFGPNPMTDDCFDLYWIAVDERFSRRGVGEGLLRYMEESLRGEGARRIYVDTSSTSAYKAARTFYERHGYRLVCVLEDFYRPGDHKMIFVKEVTAVGGTQAQI